MVIEISRTDLARNTRDIVDQVRHGQTIMVRSYGEDQIVLLDALDYWILKAVADYALKQTSEPCDDVSGVLCRYLNAQISLAKAAELLGISRFDLMERFERLTIPLRLGPETLKDAHAELAEAERAKASPE